MSRSNLQTEHSLSRQKDAKSRKAPRFDASVLLNFKSISRVGGIKVKLINISRRGALIESRERMSPRSHIFLRVTTDKAVYLIKGRVVRCSIPSMKGRVFQSAIAFNEDFTILPAGLDDDSEFLLQLLMQTDSG